MRTNTAVVRNRKIKGGAWVIQGTRLRVSVVVELVASGYKIKDIKRIYPYLSEDMIKSALEFAADNIDTCR